MKKKAPKKNTNKKRLNSGGADDGAKTSSPPEMLSLALCLGLASAFVPPTSMQQLARPTVEPSTVVMGGRKPLKPAGYAADVKKNARPLSAGSNFPTTKNIQIQRNGFGTFVQKFQTASGKSKYGVPIFLPNGNVNPAYLAAERKEMASQSKRNRSATENKRKKLVANKQFELADYIRKAIGQVGSGKDYYQSGK